MKTNLEMHYSIRNGFETFGDPTPEWFKTDAEAATAADKMAIAMAEMAIEFGWLDQQDDGERIAGSHEAKFWKKWSVADVHDPEVKAAFIMAIRNEVVEILYDHQGDVEPIAGEVRRVRGNQVE